MRLNLGCGNDIRSGYINVDFRRLPGVDFIADLSQVPWPFDSDSADEILMLDFLEHFPYALTNPILMECYRVLKPGGELVVQVPDVLHLARALAQEGDYLCNTCGSAMWHEARWEARDYCEKCGQTSDSVSEAAMRRLFGGQDFAGNFHQAAFTRRSLELKAHQCGFTESPQYEEQAHQWANWNFKARFTKGDLW